MPKFVIKFAEDPDWGVERKFLNRPSDPGSRHNYGQLNYANALAMAKAHNLPIDLSLAVASCVAEAAYDDQGVWPIEADLTVTPNPTGMPEMAITMVRQESFEPRTIKFNTADILRYHIPTITRTELKPGTSESLPESLWQMSTHPEAGGSRVKFGRMHAVGDGWFGETKPTNVVGLYLEAIGDPHRDPPMILAQFPIQRLDLTGNERTLIQQNDDACLEMVVKQRSNGGKIEGKTREELIAGVRKYKEAVAAAEAARRKAEEPEPTPGVVERVTSFFKRR